MDKLVNNSRYGGTFVSTPVLGTSMDVRPFRRPVIRHRYAAEVQNIHISTLRSHSLENRPLKHLGPSHRCADVQGTRTNLLVLERCRRSSRVEAQASPSGRGWSIAALKHLEHAWSTVGLSPVRLADPEPGRRWKEAAGLCWFWILFY